MDDSITLNDNFDVEYDTANSSIDTTEILLRIEENTNYINNNINVCNSLILVLIGVFLGYAFSNFIVKGIHKNV